MEIRLLNEQQAEQIYRSYMVQDFPPSELKPFASVQGLMRRGLYEPLALYEDGALAAYAWLVVLPGCPGALLDYFAVLPERRGSGVGTRALQALAGHYAPSRQMLIIECEHPACAPDPAAARRRVGFYLRGRGQAHRHGKPAVRRAVPDLRPCPAAAPSPTRTSAPIWKRFTAPWCRSPTTAATWCFLAAEGRPCINGAALRHDAEKSGAPAAAARRHLPL